MLDRGVELGGAGIGKEDPVQVADVAVVGQKLHEQAILADAG